MTTTEEGGFGMSRTPGAILLSGVGGARSNPPRTDGNDVGAAQLSDHNQPAVTATASRRDRDGQKEHMMTEPAKKGYLVFARSAVETWEKIGSADQKSANAAIRAVVADLPEDQQTGTFVAVPARSWQPVALKPVTRFVTASTFGAA